MFVFNEDSLCVHNLHGNVNATLSIKLLKDREALIAQLLLIIHRTLQTNSNPAAFIVVPVSTRSTIAEEIEKFDFTVRVLTIDTMWKGALSWDEIWATNVTNHMVASTFC